MTVSSDGPVGCSRMAKALEIERSPGISCLAFPTNNANCSLRNSPVTSRLQPTKQTTKKTTVVFRCPSDGKVSFSESQNSSNLNQECCTGFGGSFVW